MLQKINIKNKKASFEYQFIDKYIAGIALLGTEIKSIRNNEANISDAYCIIKNHEVFLVEADKVNDIYLLYTKEKKILKIFQYFEGNSNLKIFFINDSNKNYSKYFKISKFEILKLLHFNEIIFILKKIFNSL